MQYILPWMNSISGLLIQIFVCVQIFRSIYYGRLVIYMKVSTLRLHHQVCSLVYKEWKESAVWFTKPLPFWREMSADFHKSIAQANITCVSHVIYLEQHDQHSLKKQWQTWVYDVTYKIRSIAVHENIVIHSVVSLSL